MWLSNWFVNVNTCLLGNNNNCINKHVIIIIIEGWLKLLCSVSVYSPASFPPSHLVSSSSGAGVVAEQAEHMKFSKYSSLRSRLNFILVAVETTGVLGPEAHVFLRDFGKRLKLVTSEPEAHSHLLQKIFVAVQQANCAANLGSLNVNHDDLNSILFWLSCLVCIVFVWIYLVLVFAYNNYYFFLVFPESCSVPFFILFCYNNKNSNKRILML